MEKSMGERYIRNYTAISEKEQEKLALAKVIVIGCGGLGGYIVELFGRIGVGHITVVDSDVFEPSNLNRQLLSAQSTLGKAKAEAAKIRMEDVNPLVEVIPKVVHLTFENARDNLLGHDVVIDALDNLPARLALISASKQLGIPLVHGAITGWRGRVSVVYPGDTALEEFLGQIDGSIHSPHGNLGFTASFVAALQASEVIKIILNRGEICRNIIKEIDLLNNSFEDIPLVSR